jgi:hypothetical protein
MPRNMRHVRGQGGLSDVKTPGHNFRNANCCLVVEGPVIDVA